MKNMIQSRNSRGNIFILDQIKCGMENKQYILKYIIIIRTNAFVENAWVKISVA